MSFELTDEQRSIRDTARQLLGSRLDDERLRHLVDQGAYADELSAELVELGWFGTTVPEELGGGGLGIAESALLAEALGEVLAPTPFLSSTAALLVLQRAGEDQAPRAWLSRLLDGSARSAVGILRQQQPGLVADAADADCLILVEGAEARLWERDEYSTETVETLDVSRRFARVLTEGPGTALPGDASTAIAMFEVLVAAESVGVAQRALDLAVEYAKARRQFGRAIGEFQAVSHRCVEMLMELEGARAAVFHAAWCADHAEADLPLAAASATAAAGRAGWRVPAGAIQVCGGIGFTWEHPAHLLLRRGRSNSVLLATPAQTLNRIAALVLDPAEVLA